jgi:hypothetical protein
MSEFQTVFGSLTDFQKGRLEIINDNPKYYTFSNIFDVANRSAPYEKVAVAKNLEYVIEAIRAEGVSPWYACSHDEYVWLLDGEVRIDLVQMDGAERFLQPDGEGTVQLEGEPSGVKMGWILLGRGHQALLPKGSAYRFTAKKPSAMIQQTIQGALTVEKWAEICEC